MDKHPDTTVCQQKKDLRASALRARAELTVDQRNEKSRLIIDRLYGMQDVMDIQSWFVYVSFNSEVETHGLIRSLLAAGKKVAVPSVDRSSKSMTASLIADFVQDLAPGSLGIPEPKPGRLRPVASGSIDVVIVPGAAFATDGSRIGYGGGYYDRFLKSWPVVSIGLAYDMQIFDWVPHDTARDIPLEYIVTESRLINCKGRRL